MCLPNSKKIAQKVQLLECKHTYVGTYIYTYIHRTSYSIYMIWQMDDQLPLNVLLQLMIYVIDLLQGTVFEVNS